MRKKLTRQQYSDKFDQQMERFNYIPQPGEMIHQCSAPYPDYWFLSNKGDFSEFLIRGAVALKNAKPMFYQLTFGEGIKQLTEEEAAEQAVVIE